MRVSGVAAMALRMVSLLDICQRPLGRCANRLVDKFLDFGRWQITVAE